MPQFAGVPESLLYLALLELHRKELQPIIDAEISDRAKRTDRANRHARIVAQLPNRFPNDASDQAWLMLQKEEAGGLVEKDLVAWQKRLANAEAKLKAREEAFAKKEDA